MPASRAQLDASPIAGAAHSLREGIRPVPLQLDDSGSGRYAIQSGQIGFTPDASTVARDRPYQLAAHRQLPRQRHITAAAVLTITEAAFPAHGRDHSRAPINDLCVAASSIAGIPMRSGTWRRRQHLELGTGEPDARLRALTTRLRVSWPRRHGARRATGSRTRGATRRSLRTACGGARPGRSDTGSGANYTFAGPRGACCALRMCGANR